MNFKLPDLNTLGMKYLRALTHPTRVRPFRDWLILLGAVCVLLLGMGVWSYFLFGTFTNPSQDASGAGATNAPSTTSLDAVQAVFAARATTRAHYLTDYHFVDPSK